MDIEYLLWLQNIREKLGTAGDLIFNFITMAALGGAVIAAVIWLCFDKKKGYRALCCFVLGNVVLQFLKNIFCVPRPWIRDERIHPDTRAQKGATGYSFPSGHTNAAASSYGALAVQSKRKGMRIFLIVLILLAGFSRNYLGVHTPQDVLVGLIIGSGSIVLVHLFFQWRQKHNISDWLLVVLSWIVMAVLCLFTVLKSYPVREGVNAVTMQADALKGYGIFAGFTTGSVLEKKYIDFDTDRLNWKRRIIRLLVSLSVTGIFYFLFHSLGSFIGKRPASVISGFAAGTALLYLSPLIFTKLEKHRS